jgi:hypothetical protein
MLLAQWQEGVTRADLAKEFSFEEFIKVCLIHSVKKNPLTIMFTPVDIT